MSLAGRSPAAPALSTTLSFFEECRRISTVGRSGGTPNGGTKRYSPTCESWKPTRISQMNSMVRMAPSVVAGIGPMNGAPQQRAFYRACRDAGFPDCADHNRPDSTGVGPLAFNIADRVRVSAAIGYLDPARNRKGLTIRPHCLVTGIIFEGHRAVGLRVISGHEEFFSLWRGSNPLCRRHRYAAHPRSVGYWARRPAAASWTYPLYRTSPESGAIFVITRTCQWLGVRAKGSH